MENNTRLPNQGMGVTQTTSADADAFWSADIAELTDVKLEGTTEEVAVVKKDKPKVSVKETEDSEDEVEETEEAISEDEQTEDGDKEESEPEEETETPEKEVEAKNLKVYKATKADGEQVEIDSETVFKVKANGKFVKVKFEDLKKDYAGRVAYDEKIRRASETAKESETKLQEVVLTNQKFEQKLKSISEDMNESNVIEALGGIADLTGSNKEEFVATWIQSMAKFVSDFTEMTPEGREAYLAKAKYNSLKKGLEHKTNEQKLQDDLKAVNQAIDDTCAKYEIAKDDMKLAFQALSKHYASIGKSPDEITVEQTADLVIGARVKDNLVQAQEESGSKIPYDEYNKLLELIIKEEKESGAKLEFSDYLTIVKNVTGGNVKASKELAEKGKPIKKVEEKSSVVDATNLADIWDM